MPDDVVKAVLFARDDISGEDVPLSIDPATGKLSVNDPKDYWKSQRFEYTDGNLLYAGYNKEHKALISESTWYIWKYTWSDDNMVLAEGPLVGAWENRLSLDWE